MCNCNNTKICGCSQPTCEPTNCACDVFISSDCVNNVKAVFECSEIETGLNLTETLEALDQFICTKFSEITNYFALINVGNGAEIYKGVDNLGRKEIRTIIGSTFIDIAEGENEITPSINEEALIEFIQDNQLNYSVENIGGEVELYLDTIATSNNNSFRIKTLYSSDNSVSITDNEDKIDFTVVGSGTTFIDNGITTSVTGAGTEGNPYVIETNNLQKTISGSTYTLTDNDDNYTLIVNNGSTAMTITVPTGLKDAFNAGFIQRGTADVTFVGSGMTVNTPISGAYKIRGQYYNAHIEVYGLLSECFLLGNLKV